MTVGSGFVAGLLGNLVATVLAGLAVYVGSGSEALFSSGWWIYIGPAVVVAAAIASPLVDRYLHASRGHTVGVTLGAATALALDVGLVYELVTTTYA